MLLTVAVLAVSVMITRFVPFIVFKNTDRLPGIVDYLGRVLPAAMMGLLVIYCFRDYSLAAVGQWAPALAAAAVVAALQWFGRNTILSIAAGTVLYMLLIRLPL